MKKIDATHKVVLIIGGLAMMFGFFGMFKFQNPIEQFFPIYIGLTLIGTVVFRKAEKLKP